MVILSLNATERSFWKYSMPELTADDGIENIIKLNILKTNYLKSP